MLKRFKWLSLILLTVLLAAIVLIVLSLIPGRQPGRSLLSEMLSRSSSTITVSSYSFDVGRKRVFEHSSGVVAAAGTLGLQLLGPDGREILRDSVILSTPALVENNGRFAAFDIGGSAVRIFDTQEILSSFDVDGTVVSASVNRNGRFCVVLQEQGGARGTVSVYNESGRKIFEVRMGSGFVLSAKLSDDNRRLSILNITQYGSRITVYDGIDTAKDNPDNVYEFDNEILLDIEYISNTQLLVLAESSVRIVDLSGDGVVNLLYDFADGKLGSYTYTNQFIALHLYDYSIGYSGKIVTLDYEGTVLGQLETSSEIASMSAYAGTLVVLDSEGILFFDKTLEEYPVSDSTVSPATAGRVLALGEDMALAANDLTASVVRREG